MPSPATGIRTPLSAAFPRSTLSDVAIWFFVVRKYSDFRAAARERRQLLARGDSSYVQYRHRRKIAAYYALRR